MATPTKDQERLALSRLFHRNGFGPLPGEFESALRDGFSKSANKFLIQPSDSVISSQSSSFTVEELGKRPEPGTFANTEYMITMRKQIKDMTLWWLDLMVKTETPHNEKMTWFWHGHWATSVEKGNFALPMFKQNKTFRKYALGDFAAFSRAMYNDGALQFWLDGQENTAVAPNENLSREFMELFTLGVNHYTEDDVKALARVFTGMQVNRGNGKTTFNPKRHDSSPVTLLGTTKSFTADEAIDLLTSREDCARFIAERMWFRFVSSEHALPSDFDLPTFGNRNIAELMRSITFSPYFYNSNYALVKSPIEWCVGVCRAFGIIPSQVKNPQQIVNGLSKLAQVPFNPPNVGGWPAGELWLTSAAAQFRLNLANLLVKSASLKDLKSVSPSQRVQYLKNHLGVYQWSKRTEDALTSAKSDPERLLLLAINSPEYVVGA